jgi:sugar transferase (PEP-CTERM/EpsH1 system associated)
MLINAGLAPGRGQSGDRSNHCEDVMPDLLFLTQRIPYPPIKGEKIRPLQILKHLRQSYDVHLGCLVDDPADQEHVPTVRGLCTTSYFATLDRARAKITCLRGLLTGAPLSVTFYHDSGLAAWVRNTLRDIRPEVIFICSSNMAPYVLDLRRPSGDSGQVCLVDLADVDSEKWRAYSQTGSAVMRWVHRREWHRTAALEGRIARECDWSTFVSKDEAALFARLQPARADHIRAVSSGVDHVYFDPAQPYPALFDTARPNFVYTGTMDYPPNVDAVTWFARDILPLIRSTEPAAQFHIVGNSPAPAVRALAEIEGVFVTGRVADVRPYVAHASACVAPMRVARGIQNKVLEAMAMARPVVVTPGGLEGIAAIPGAELLLADTAEAVAQACLDALQPQAHAMGQAARARVLADFIWAERLRGFDALLDTHKTPETLPA